MILLKCLRLQLIAGYEARSGLQEGLRRFVRGLKSKRSFYSPSDPVGQSAPSVVALSAIET